MAQWKISKVEINRRQVLATALGAASIAASPAMGRGGGSRPNFLFILADDLGYADLSCYGRRDYQTPSLDLLARQGMRFTQAYANSPVCSATRTALITGRYQYRLPIGLEEPLTSRDVGLSPRHPTMPSLLRSVGYKTALIGKWHLGALPKFGPLQSGYDHFWGFRNGGIDYFTHEMMGHPDLWEDDAPITRAGYLTDLLGDQAVNTLERFARARDPFLMSLHFSAPHWPWEGPGDEVEAKRLSARAQPFAQMDLDGGTLATYAEMVMRLDFQVGRVMEALDRLGLAANTVVVFTSDNGGERFSDTWPFSGRKTELLEGGLRVPAIIRWPGMVRPSSTSDAQIMSMDWMATFLAAVNAVADPNYPLDGIDLAPALREAPLGPRALFWRYKLFDQQACRLGDWKYLKIRNNSFLFNLAVDPLERANLKEREPGRFARLQQAWREWDATMLPLDPSSFTHGFSGGDIADRMGIEAR